MYKYVWDPGTGGLLLTSEIEKFSKEPRPVYYKELDILGFDRFWQYPKDDSAPIMWAEANNYIYKGRLVAKAKGGSAFEAPEIEILDEPEASGSVLDQVDVEAMISKNAMLLGNLAQETIQKIYNVFLKYQGKIDVFYVAFSGGKDSVVALDLVQRALPHDDFLVLFGDTRMEVVDTYNVVEQVKAQCEDMGIRFLISQSEYLPDYTWREFGPPAQTLRWCCSVHKTAPQILLLRKYTGNNAFKGMAFTGIRGDESATRSKYDELSIGEKHKGQLSFHGILEWNSAEVFLYIFANKLILNETYKKGNSRAGCLVCPMATYKNFFFKEKCYGGDRNSQYSTKKYNDMILETTSKVFSSEGAVKEFFNTSGWKARKTGRELNFSRNYIQEDFKNGIFTLVLERERTSWREWIKTLGDIISLGDDKIEILYQGNRYCINRNVTKAHQEFSVNIKTNTKIDILFMAEMKIVFRKAGYCIGCQVCEANCPFGYLHMDSGKIRIDDRCVKCHKCYEVFRGCLVENSLRIPKGVMKMGSVDRYANMGVELDWIKAYFADKDEYWGNTVLGTNKIKYLKNFLADAEVTEKNKITAFGMKIDVLGLTDIRAWGLMLCNLVYSSEFNWWVMHTIIGETYTPTAIKEMLGDISNNSKNNIASAYKNIFISNPYFGTELGLGLCDYELKNGKRTLNSVTRGSWSTPNPEVILYSLYKFAEACGSHYQFTLTDLLDDSIERDGVSPTRIFGLNRETMVPILNGLSINYREFISVSFTLDLDVITLRDDKTSKDVLELF